MSLLDFSVLFFFATIMFKVVYDSFEFWREFDESAHTVRPAHIPPKHLPAPSRPSPRQINTTSRTVVRKKATVQPIRRPDRQKTVA